MKDGVTIKHAQNGGEVRVESYRVDGFCQDTGCVYSFHGCFWHGCMNCYSRSTINPKAGKMMGELFDATLQRTKNLKAKGYNVIEIWEHEWNEQMKEDPLAQHIVSEFKVEEPIAPGDAIYGGRTEAIRPLYDQNTDGGQGKYLDFMSLPICKQVRSISCGTSNYFDRSRCKKQNNS